MHGAHVYHFMTLENVFPRSLLLEIVLLVCSLLFWSKNQWSWCKGEAFTSTGICLNRFVRIWLRAACLSWQLQLLLEEGGEVFWHLPRVFPGAAGQCRRARAGERP